MAKLTYQARIAEFKRRLVRRALRCTEGNVKAAAAKLGTTPNTLTQMLRRLGVRRKEFVTWEWPGEQKPPPPKPRYFGVDVSRGKNITSPRKKT